MDEQQKRIVANLFGVAFIGIIIAQWMVGIGWLTVLTAVLLTALAITLHLAQEIGTGTTYLLALLAHTPLIDPLNLQILAWLRALTLVVLAILLLEQSLKGMILVAGQYLLALLVLFYAGLILAPAFTAPVWAWVILLTVGVVLYGAWQYAHFNQWQQISGH